MLRWLFGMFAPRRTLPAVRPGPPLHPEPIDTRETLFLTKSKSSKDDLWRVKIVDGFGTTVGIMAGCRATPEGADIVIARIMSAKLERERDHG